MLLVLLDCLHVAVIFLLVHVGECFQVEPNLCESSCAGSPASDLSHYKGVRYTYRYSTTITTTLHGSGSGRNGLALDCVVDIQVVSNCHLMMQIRNPQIKRLSPQKEHSVQRLKSLRESLERTRLKFSLRGGKVTALCLQEGEQVWALNIKRAILSMLQTSPMASKLEFENETDLYGTCASRYERRGALLLKTRDLKQCQQSRLQNFWPHSVALTEDSSVQLELHCVQRPASPLMEAVNCTEAVSVAGWSGTAGAVKTQTVSTLLLLRALEGAPSPADLSGNIVAADLQFEDEGAAGPGKTKPATPQTVAQVLPMLCSLSSDLKLVSKEFLELVFLLKDLNLSQLRTLWQDVSFKCRNDWQPLLDALPACGTENCVLLLTELMKNKELEEGQAQSLLNTVALMPHPSPPIIESINALLEVPELRSKALLAGSSLAHQLCRRSRSDCSELPQIQTFIQTNLNILMKGCEGEEDASRVTELLYALKSVGNAGLSASDFIPLLSGCMLEPSTSPELRLASIKAFRRFPCSADRSVLLQLYGSSQEDPEVRVAAYQQLLRCPDRRLFEVVKMTLANESSSQVGSFVWSHLTNVLRSEDPMKQTLIESLPDDIISRDFEAEFLKYSSYSDYTFTSGFGVTNVEASLIFSPKSFLPRSASVNLTVYFHGRAHNLLEVDLHGENAEPLLKNVFGHETESESTAQSVKHEAGRTRRQTHHHHKGGKEACLSTTRNYLNQARAMLFGQRNLEENRPKCRVGVKVFGNELSVFTCDDLHHQIDQISLSLAGLAVQLLKGHEVQLNHRALLMTEELRLPSLAGVPVKLGVNMTSLLSLRLKGNINYRDMSHFSLSGYIKPSAYVGLSAMMGVDGALGRAAVEWLAELRSSTSVDGSVQLQEGREVRITLNTPEDLLDVFSASSRVIQLSGDHQEEIKGPKNRIQKTTCTPKAWSKLIGWQLCSNASYPSSLPVGLTFPPPGPVHLSLRLLKLDRGLSYYLLEAAFSLFHQRGSWLPREASIHLLLATPQSSVPRDMSLDVAFNSHRLLLRITHPLKTILLQGQLEQERNVKSGKLEFMIDGLRYYILGLVDSQIFPSEQKTRYHLEAKMAADAHPMILSANVTRGLGRKTSFSATLKNVFRETALLSVALERRRDSSGRQYSAEAELLLPDVVGCRMLGLMEQKGSLWSSVLRLKYGLGGDARFLRQECYTSQRLKSERDSNLTYMMRADHEFYCTGSAPINHKIHLRHEESPRHIKSSVDVSYGKHWDEINNKHKVLLSQSFKNQSTDNHTSYTLEFNLQVPQKNLNYRTQLLHTHVTQQGSESSTHLKINYNNLMPLVAGLLWKSPPKDAMSKKWEGSFNVDTPWLFVHSAHKLNRLHHHTLQLTAELTASKWLTVRDLMLEAFYRDRGREKEARLELHTPAVTYLQAGAWGVAGKRSVKASCSLSSAWTPPLRADLSLGSSKSSHTLQLASTYGHHNVSCAAALNTVDKSLKKRRATVEMSLSKLKGPSTRLEFEGVVEELRKDKKTYQKTAKLQLRQPFQIFPQTLLLQETFTVDLLKGLYVLESRAGFHDNREVIHTLTLGYRPPSPFVCSALIHPFSSDVVPSHSEICVTVTNNQTHKDVRGRLRIGSKEKLTFSGRVELKPSHSVQRAIKVQADFIHQLQLQLPSSAVLEGDVCWTPKHNKEFDYQARGKLRVERQECKVSVQLNGTSSRVNLHSSLTHPFKSKIPRTLEVEAAADVSVVPGGGSSSVLVRADGKDKVMLEAQMAHWLQRGDRGVELMLNLSQNLLPAATDLHVNMAANLSSDSVSLRGSFTQGRETLLAQVKGTLRRSQSLQLVVSGDLRHTMTILNLLPPVMGVDGSLGQSDGLIEGQLRVRVMETVYSVELRRQRDEFEENLMEGKSSRTLGWFCVRSDVEFICVNVSRLLENQGSGEIHVELNHSVHLLAATGASTDCRAEVKWTRGAGRWSALAELHAGSEYLNAEFDISRTDDLIPGWKFSSRLQHRATVLLKRGVSSSLEAKAYYQLETDGLDMRLIFFAEDVRTADFLFTIASKNETTVLAASLWQQTKLLQGFMPTSVQMNCTADAAAHRLSAHCYGSVAERPVEVRTFRSYRPHNRLCYGLMLTSRSISAQAKSCYSPSGQRELSANLTHSSVPLLARLGVPSQSGARLLLRPGPHRWVLGTVMEAGPWRADCNLGLRSERPGLYGWHGRLKYKTSRGSREAAVTGRVRLESWCHIWADVGVDWDSVSCRLLLSVRCSGAGKLVWVQTESTEGKGPLKTSLTVSGHAGKDGLKGSLSLERLQDSLQCSILQKDHKAEEVQSLQHHHRASVSLWGSSQIHVRSSGACPVARSAQVNITALWGASTLLTASLQQNLETAGAPELLTVTMSSTPSRAQFKVDNAACAVHLLANQHKGGKHGSSSWTVSAQQRCLLLKTLLPPQSSASISITRSGCLTDLRAVLRAEGRQTGGFNLSLTCAEEPRAALGLQLGRCNFGGRLGKIKVPRTEVERSAYSVNLTSHCPSLQGSVLPVSSSLRGLLLVDVCELAVSSSLSADGQDLSVDLSQSCRVPHLSGTFAHSFTGLRSRGVPQLATVAASVPRSPEHPGDLLIKVGTCQIRASKVVLSKGSGQWLWVLESECPELKAHMNGSVQRDPQGRWTTMLQTDVEGKRGFLRLHATAWPELNVEAELSHDLLPLRGLPKQSSLKMISKPGTHRFVAEALVQTEECSLGADAAVTLLPGLQGALAYHNNCTMIQEWFSPGRLQVSGSLAVAPNLVESHVSMKVDEKELQTSTSLKKTKDMNEATLHLNHSVPLLHKLGLPLNAALAINSRSHGDGSYIHSFDCSAGKQKIIQEISVTKRSGTLRVNNYFRHAVNYLKKLGVPANNSVLVELRSAEVKTLTLQSQFGGHQAGLRLKVKILPVTKEIRATTWHSWLWLRDRGLPLNMEALCSIQGVLSELRSRVQLTVDRHKLLASGFNVSSADGHLAALISFGPAALNHTAARHNLDAVLTAQFRGPLRSASLDLHHRDWRVRAVGDVGGLGTDGGTKEGRVTLKHTVQGQAAAALQVEAWGRLTESQLRCSMAVNPELSSSLALIVQGHHVPHSKDLMVKVVQNVPHMLVYLPSQLNIRSQVNQSESSVAGLVEVSSGRRRLWAVGELAATHTGYKQALELKHSYQQLKPLPRTVALRTTYESRRWSHQVQHAAVWGNQEFSMSGLYSAPQDLEMGNQTLKFQISCVPRVTNLEVALQRSLRGRLDSVSLGWMRHGQLEQVGALSSYSHSEESDETRLELKQPFSSTLSQFSLHTVSHTSHKEQRNSHQAHLSWGSVNPVNVSLSLNKQWWTNSSRGQACALVSAQQMSVSPVKGCVSVGQEGTSYLQNAEFRWDNRSVKQSMKYQKAARGGMDSLQVNVALDRVSPAPCPSHTLMVKVQSNLRDRVEHTVLLGLCPPQPTLSWSGSHRLNSGDELFHTTSHLSVTGRPAQCSFTLSLSNSSNAQGTNVSLFSESRMGNWSVEVGGDALSWPSGSGVQFQATLDHKDQIRLRGTVEGRCLQTIAGYTSGTGLHEDLTVRACMDTDGSLILTVTGGRDGSETLGVVSVGAADEKLLLRASGCLESLTAVEKRVLYLSSQIQNKLLERIKTLKHRLVEFRRQSGDSQLLQELSSAALHVSQHLESVLAQRGGGGGTVLAHWQSSVLRHILTVTLPRVLGLLQHASLLGQQELRRPLATLAGVYQDVRGHRPDAVWREVVLLWSEGLVEVLPALLENPQLRPLSQGAAAAAIFALDVAGQQTFQWIESRLAVALSGVRKRLASVYKFSPSDCSVTVSVPLPPFTQWRVAESGLVAVLLEEGLLRPLQALASLSPAAELYRLKRKIMDGPFAHRALLLADQFVVTFDGHLYELPGSCPLLLAQDATTGRSSFTLLLGSDARSFLLIQMSNSSVHIQRDGQVKTDCGNAAALHRANGVTVRKRSNTVHVSNEEGGSVFCDLKMEVCSFTLDGWLHGASTGLLGTNDNEAGNDFPLRDGSQAQNLEDFLHSWQMNPKCDKPAAAVTTSSVSCDFLFAADSPLSSCFRVVDPARFLSVCESSSVRAPCRLASAFVQLCQWNYVPVELPVQCLKV